MLKHILVPLDGSPLAEAALAPAMALAQRFGAEILLMRTVFEPEASEQVDQSTHVTAAPDKQNYLDFIVACMKKEGISARTALLPLEPAEGIVDEADFNAIDLIVMTTHGRRGLDALLHPSITWKVLQQTNAPILACKCADPQHPTVELPRFMTDPQAPILVPLDGSMEAEAALPLAQELARSFGNPLLLVRAAEQRTITPSIIGYAPVIEDANAWSLEEAESYLKGKRVELASTGLEVKIEYALAPAVSLIEEIAHEANAGLIVIASHGRGWLGRLALGSVAKSILSHLELPILLARRQPIEAHTQSPAALSHTASA